MATLAERLQELRQTRDTEAQTAAAEQEETSKANWDATVDQLRKLIRAELEVTDSLDEVHDIRRAHIHGLAEGRFAVIVLEGFWFGLRVSDTAATETRLLALTHCSNDHLVYEDYPTNADDDWNQVLMRVEAAQAVYAIPSNCAQCAAERNAIRHYQPKLSVPDATQ